MNATWERRREWGRGGNQNVDKAGAGTRTGVDRCCGTQEGNGDRSEDGNESGSKKGNDDEDGIMDGNEDGIKEGGRGKELHETAQAL